MGLFSSIGKVVGKVVGGVAGSPILSGLGTIFGNPAVGAGIGFLGSALQGSQQRAAAKRQMDFQSDMSNTSYQRAMADMYAAGLNPILAYKQGGASSPSGAMESVPDFGAATLSGARQLADVQNLRQQNNNLVSQNKLTQEQILKQKLENQAWSTLTPTMRAFVMSGSGISSAAGLASLGGKAAKALPGAFRGLAKGLGGSSGAKSGAGPLLRALQSFQKGK